MSATKPLVSVLNTNHPIASGLVFDAEYTENSGTTTTERVSAVAGTLKNSASWVSSPYGPAVSTDSATGKGITYTTGAAVNSQTAWSIHFRGLKSDDGGSSFGYLFAKENGATNKYIEIFVNGSGQPIVIAIDRASANNGNWTIPSPANGEYNDYIITYDGSSVSNNPVVYKNGTSITVTQTHTPTGALATDGTTFTVGNRQALDLNWGGNFVLFRFWNRVLSSSEATQLATDPWCIYEANGMLAFRP